jgi:uncharacterized alkaline shock family protein YloU
MTDDSLSRAQPDRDTIDAAHLDGHTIEELGEYLDRGRMPRDESIETSAAAQHALAALSRLRSVAPKLIEAEADSAPVRPPSWFKTILDQIGVQAHAGRDIPLHHEDERTTLQISEGAVRALIRDVGDAIDGILVERSKLDGDVETPGEPIRVRIDVSIYSTAEPSEVLEELNREVAAALATHTELNVTAIEVKVRDFDRDPEDVS